jgi:hypothetical protein
MRIFSSPFDAEIGIPDCFGAGLRLDGLKRGTSCQDVEPQI